MTKQPHCLAACGVVVYDLLKDGGVKKETTPAVVLRNDTDGGWLSFSRPRRLCIARHIDEVLPVLREIEQAVKTEGLYAAGFIAYEAAPAFDPSLEVHPERDFPLVWFGLYDAPARLASLPASADRSLAHLDWKPTVTARHYRACIARIKKHISAGDTYQVNFTYRLRAACDADPWKLFLEMAAAHDPPYGAFIDTGKWAVCSASPELFFKLKRNWLESRPMKGTASRGLWFEHDRRQAAALAASAKDRAENLMIADMVRNDMGRVAVTGSVHAPHLFSVERFSTVWQMTSTVRARTRASVVEIFQALFPPSSITGAPKTRTMQIIADLETSPRRIYTGAIGCIAPGRHAQFSVAIRTLLINRPGRRAEYGIGGGIVWDSRPGSELEESRIKARILHRPPAAFDLLETILWTPGRRYWLLPYHLRRLRQSAEYFGFRLDSAQVRAELIRCAAGLAGTPHRIRLLVSKSGAVSLTASSIEPGMSSFPDIALAAQPVDAANPLLYHKTTCRQAYQDAIKLAPGASDVLLYNQKGEITESTIANIAFDLRGRLCTPPLRCGLLPGTLRAFLLEQGAVIEKGVTVEQLASCRRIFLLNGVRGMQQVKIISSIPSSGKK
jgi:para-aminobenzoate synthetase / 4-amino-4-deoxychorismate lyase